MNWELYLYLLQYLRNVNFVPAFHFQLYDGQYLLQSLAADLVLRKSQNLEISFSFIILMTIGRGSYWVKFKGVIEHQPLGNVGRVLIISEYKFLTWSTERLH